MTSPAGSPQPRPRISFRAWAFRLFVLLAVVLIALLARAGLATGGPPPTSLDPTLLALATLVANPATPSATSESSGGSIQPLPTRTTISGTLVYSAREAGRSHLWAISQGDPAPTRLDLTAREQDVLRCIVHGRSYQQTAEDLGIGLETVRTHIRNLYRKLQVHTVAEAVALAIRKKLI